VSNQIIYHQGKPMPMHSQVSSLPAQSPIPIPNMQNDSQFLTASGAIGIDLYNNQNENLNQMQSNQQNSEKSLTESHLVNEIAALRNIIAFS